MASSFPNLEGEREARKSKEFQEVDDVVEEMKLCRKEYVVEMGLEVLVSTLALIDLLALVFFVLTPNLYINKISYFSQPRINRTGFNRYHNYMIEIPMFSSFHLIAWK